MMTDSTALKPLPIGIQSFAELREGGHLYVDKTADIYRLISAGKAIFLSRPRRFGKSLLISTLEELFKGSEALFRGLAIHDKWDWMQKYPIVRIDWSRYNFSSLDDLRRQLGAHFKKIANQHGVELAVCTLDELIEELRKKTGQRVVVLIDEYDKLMLDAIADPERFAQMKSYLHSTYCGLKAVGEHIRFLFLTGVSKFSGISIFSGLNNLNDITLDEKFSTLCGYTQDELETNFAEHIEATSKKLNYETTQLLTEMKAWYNGYSWDETTSVYNPFSILLFFQRKDFGSFWFNTGTPSFLVEIVKTNAEVPALATSVMTTSLDLPETNPYKANLRSLLFQTGYLTIKSIKRGAYMKPEYTLDFPNLEVKDSFLLSLLGLYLNEGQDGPEIPLYAMKEELINGNVAAFETKLRTLLAGIPYPLTSKETESHYHVITLTWLRLLGFNIKAEVPTDKGRIDAVLELPNQIIVIEIKLGQDARDKEKLLDAALAQIKTMGYADAYMNTPGKVSILGLAIAEKEVACRLEVLKEK